MRTRTHLCGNVIDNLEKVIVGKRAALELTRLKRALNEFEYKLMAKKRA